MIQIIKGHKARGLYWTKPDKSGKEVSRDVDIDEVAYSELFLIMKIHILKKYLISYLQNINLEELEFY